MIKVIKYIDKIHFKPTSKYLQNYFLIRDRSWIEAAGTWPENIFWLEAAAINGTATVFKGLWTFISEIWIVSRQREETTQRRKHINERKLSKEIQYSRPPNNILSNCHGPSDRIESFIGLRGTHIISTL